MLAKGAAVILSSFQNWETTSLIAPSTAEGTAIPWAIDGTSEPLLALAPKSAADSLAHSSNWSMDSPSRTGMEPLRRLNFRWNSSPISK